MSVGHWMNTSWTSGGPLIQMDISWTSGRLLSPLDIRWRHVGRWLDTRWTFVSFGHEMRWTPVGHQMPDTCRREQRPLLEGIRPVSRSLSVLGSGDDLSSCYCSWWWWRWTPRTPTILWTTWVLWSVLSWLSRVPLLMVVDINSTPKRFSLAAHLSALKCSELASTDFNPFYSKSIAHCSERLKCS